MIEAGRLITAKEAEHRVPVLEHPGARGQSATAAFIQLLPKGFATTSYRSTNATVFVPVEGRGSTWPTHEALLLFREDRGRA
jgi:gentisate 1,2-dioxygenase